jgi:hypothetical protein
MGTKILLEQCLTTPAEMDYMAYVPFVSVFIFMYAMVCTRPDIAQVMGVLNRFKSNLGCED